MMGKIRHQTDYFRWQGGKRAMKKPIVTIVLIVFLVLKLGAQDDPLPIDKQLQQQATQAPVRMQFRGKTADDCRRWQAEFAAKLRALLGPFEPPKTWRTVSERTVDLADHRREELVLIAKGVPPLPLYLLVPKGNGKKRAGVVAVHGHGAFGHDIVAGRELTPGMEEEMRRLNYDYGRQLVRRGYVVAVPCLTPFGRRLGDRKAYGNNDPCATTFIRLQLLGKVLMAENLRDILWSLTFLAGHEKVDADRLGCVGLSYGGRMTMLAAALEPRIKVAVISGALNCLQERIQGRYSCGAQVIPGLLEFGDVPEIASLMAPRPCLWEVGDKDTLLPRSWQDIALKRIERAYEAVGAKNNLQVDRFEGGHQWHGEEALRLLDRVLK
jgi:dienelactone hydrolase